MLFDKYEHDKIEPDIQTYWNKHKILESLRKKNQKGKKFNFLQGPPYTSGKVHLGTAWNTALKDIAIRYKRSQGFHVWDRNGYDVHGLPTAHKVMAKHNLKTKDDIEAFGVGKFIKECIKFSLEMGDQMTKDFQRLGVTLDYTNSYMALKNEYMEGEWWMLKEAHKKDRLYLGEKVMTWCEHCETAVAKHECEYQNLDEKSIFVKFPVKGKDNEYVIIWTTTPWTIPYNLAIMAGPEIDYVKVEVEGEEESKRNEENVTKKKGKKEIWILAKALAGVVIQAVIGRKMKVLEEFKGEQLEGLEYIHPFTKYIDELKQLKHEHPKVHTVILSEEHVDTTAGSGLVHAAPGCGPEDQEACKPYKIPPFNNLTEDGYFPEEMGKFARWRAKVDDDKFREAMEEDGILLAVTDVEHEYPHCWRCHKPVIFRLTKQWFFKIEDLRNQMIKENSKVDWVPQTNAFDAWTTHLKDNSITRQRYWGTPVPIWKCDLCEQIEVIGSIKELKEKAGKVPDDIHKPWIDEVKWKCSCDAKSEYCNKGHKSDCGGNMIRIPDIFDVWIDAGTASWNCLYYPAQEKYFKDFFPADLILEATEQVRLWFSMLSICSQLSMSKNCFKNVYMHGMLRDVSGVKMSKSLGNIISPDELVEKYGADVLRYYMCQTNAGQDISFSWEEAKVKGRQLHILWNIHKLLINLAKENKVDPFKLKVTVKDLEEKYILSKLHSTIKEVETLFDEYRLDETIKPMEDLFLGLSRVYIQMVRDKSSVGSETDKKIVIYTISEVLFECLKMFNIISPFISEAIYLNLKKEFGLKEESISHYKFPKHDAKKINTKLEEQVAVVGSIIQSALNARETAKLGLRWPVKEIVVASEKDEILDAVKKLEEIVKRQTNAKSVRLEKVKLVGKLSEPFCESEFKNGFVYLNTERTAELDAEGYAREVMRKVQSLRRKAGLEKSDRIDLVLKCNVDLSQFIDDIKEKVGAKSLDISDSGKGKVHEEFKVKGEEFEVWF